MKDRGTCRFGQVGYRSALYGKQTGALCRQARSATESVFNEARLGNAIDVHACLPLVTQIAESVARNPEALISLARLKQGDDYTYMHFVAVCALIVALAQALGMDEEACRDAGMAGLLHDIGKAQVPLDILNKPGKLTESEFATVRPGGRRQYGRARRLSA